jgi:hypothetical protein
MNLNNMNLTRLNLQQPSYPSSKLGRSTFFKSLYDTTDLPYNKKYDNCQNDLCYTYSKNYIYQPHTAYGMVGTTATSYLARRHRL